MNLKQFTMVYCNILSSEYLILADELFSHKKIIVFTQLYVCYNQTKQYIPNKMLLPFVKYFDG